MDGEALKQAMARVAASVAVVVARDGGAWRGASVSSHCSASLEPPLVALTLERTSAVLALLRGDPVFNLCVLSRRDEFLADRFSQRAPAPAPGWADIEHRIALNGLPLVGAGSWFSCRAEDFADAGDHRLVIAAVDDCGLGEAEPLILYNRAFWTVG